MCLCVERGLQRLGEEHRVLCLWGEGLQRLGEVAQFLSLLLTVAGQALPDFCGVLDLSLSDLLSDECLGPVTESWGVTKAMKMGMAEQRLRRCSELEGKIKS